MNDKKKNTKQPEQEPKKFDAVTLSFGKTVDGDRRQEIMDQATYESNKRIRVDASKAAALMVENTDCVFVRYDADSTKGYFRRWTGNHWATYAMLDVQADIMSILAPYATARTAEQIIDEMKPLNSVAIEKLDSDNFGVLLRNGIMYVNSSGKLATEKHRRDRYNTWIIDERAKSMPTPKWDEFLGKVAPDPEVQDLIQEMLGYILHAGLSYQVIFVPLGPAKTGKTTLMRVIEDILGRNNCSAIAVDDLHQAHSTSGLLGKRLNISEESNYTSRKGETVLKAISGGSSVGVNIKNGPFLNKKLDSVFIIPTNEPPRFNDRTEALWQRLVFVPMEQELSLTKFVTIKDILTELRPEYPGIIIWALKGLKRLAARTDKSRAGKFTGPARSVELLRQHRLESDPFLTWFKEFIRIVPGKFTAKSDAYLVYKEWYEQNLGDRGTIGSIVFFKRMAGQLTARGLKTEVRKRVRTKSVVRNILINTGQAMKEYVRVRAYPDVVLKDFLYDDSEPGEDAQNDADNNAGGSGNDTGGLTEDGDGHADDTDDAGAGKDGNDG